MFCCASFCVIWGSASQSCCGREKSQVVSKWVRADSYPEDPVGSAVREESRSGIAHKLVTGIPEGEDSYPKTGSFYSALGTLTTSEGLSKPGGLPCFEAEVLKSCSKERGKVDFFEAVEWYQNLITSPKPR